MVTKTQVNTVHIISFWSERVRESGRKRRVIYYPAAITKYYNSIVNISSRNNNSIIVAN